MDQGMAVGLARKAGGEERAQETALGSLPRRLVGKVPRL